MSGVNPVDYLDASLRVILDGHPQGGIDDLLRWCYAPATSFAAKGNVVAQTKMTPID